MPHTDRNAQKERLPCLVSSVNYNQGRTPGIRKNRVIEAYILSGTVVQMPRMALSSALFFWQVPGVKALVEFYKDDRLCGYILPESGFSLFT